MTNIPKITPEMVANSIMNIEFIEFKDRLTICVITLNNGFMVTGETGVIRSELFDSELGKKYSQENAMNKVWFYLGVCLQESIESIDLETLNTDTNYFNKVQI